MVFTLVNAMSVHCRIIILCSESSTFMSNCDMTIEMQCFFYKCLITQLYYILIIVDPCIDYNLSKLMIYSGC